MWRRFNSHRPRAEALTPIPVKEFAVLEQSREVSDLVKAIRAITLKFESHKDLVTALTRCLSRIYECKQGLYVGLIKHGKHFLAYASTFEAYGCSLALTVITKKDSAAVSSTGSSPPNESQMDALREAANYEALSRIFLDSFNSQYNSFIAPLMKWW